MCGTAVPGAGPTHRAQNNSTSCPWGCGERACPLTHSTVQVWDARQQEIIPSSYSLSPLAPAWQSPVGHAEFQVPLLRRGLSLNVTQEGGWHLLG